MVEASSADPCDNMSRVEIKDYLLAMADRHIEAKSGYQSLRVDAALGLNIW